MNPRVLIIDDSLTVRMDLRDAFALAGFTPSFASTQAEAYQALNGGPFDVVVLDVVLPDGDGLELLGALRDIHSFGATPVILLSTEAEVKDRIRGLNHGADAYIGKPYEASYVVARATELLRQSQGAKRPAFAPLILIVDDSLTYREELSFALRNAGYRVASANSGMEGLQKAADLHPDAILVDGVMPNMSGTSVVRKIRLDPGLNATPCLLLTATEGSASEVVALDAGADAYVQKGEGLELVLTRLGAMLRATHPSRDRVHSTSLMGPKRILAIDDSPTYLQVLSQELRTEGYEVIKACSGEEALDLLTIERVDCILLDLLMPNLSGTETCKRIKSSGVLSNTPLIMLTAREERESMIEGINAGADDYVAKSADFDVIKARVRAALRRKHFEDENQKVRDELLLKESETQTARRVADARQELLKELSAKNRELAFRLGELERLNKELEVFAYSVSHDLRQPLRAMDGFSKILLEDYGDQLDNTPRHYLSRIRAGAQRMGALIDGILTLSRVSRGPISQRSIRLDVLAEQVVQQLRDAEPDRSVQVQIEPGLSVEADPDLMTSLLENLLGNAWKFTERTAHAMIEVGTHQEGASSIFFVKDNGAGFDMSYADKLFGPFQRLHRAEEFEGTGIGLATVQRIVQRHGGRIWAESKPNLGATFFFELKPGSG